MNTRKLIPELKFDYVWSMKAYQRMTKVCARELCRLATKKKTNTSHTMSRESVCRRALFVKLKTKQIAIDDTRVPMKWSLHCAIDTHIRLGGLHVALHS